MGIRSGSLTDYRGSQLKPDHDSTGGDAGRFRTTHWPAALLSAQSQAPGSKTLIHRLRRRYAALLREEVSCTVCEPGEVDEEIHGLCEALIAAEGRLGP